MRELASIRKDINSVDSAIRELFLLRMSLAHEVAETKAQSDDKIYKPDREADRAANDHYEYRIQLEFTQRKERRRKENKPKPLDI